MPSTELLIAFFVTTAIFAYIPGPAMLYAAAQTIARGRWSGLMATLGIHLGCYVHVMAAAAGLSVLFHAVPVLYLVVKLAGAAYLVWLGISMLRAKAEGGDAALPALEAKSGRRAFLESITVEVLNPKTALFFLAFLPQFIDASAGLPVWAQFLILGTIVNLIFSSADLVCVMLAGVLVARLKRSSGAQRLMRRAGGTLLVGLGAHLALQRT
ncbi:MULTISPECIES: LysE family translocator [Phyllobacteriaceae]|jgi:threonine/homoserine/homoserine lactone efflux protein|uniref:Amino acid transporter n=1 Tax=Mesorhizobium hungaricum TaxID=1566387 RepID=A0A1C2EA25_9HYPH|nr:MULTISPECIES: LysE family translocator [Mesorhizobium]MBN9237214.1 LysE family translocator [Mesorhizobium sp.]MDQ0329418.1 threonine/homoserine/homoserine lactone efflux protein [Mesorhizobium sp. YL-MeA3-2017]OCX23835.1 amino acid transporter [Mesorhizobium hungaricum]